MYPILLDLGWWQLRSYGVLVALAINEPREFFRGDPPVVAGILVPQAVSALLVAAGLVGAWLIKQPAWRSDGSAGD